jgi:hypothetical protein
LDFHAVIFVDFSCAHKKNPLNSGFSETNTFFLNFSCV